jgi:sulfoxide reductase heme-binding subunit YedZ
VILTLLAATSTQRIQRALGRRWQHLHNWVYLALPLVGLHFIWSVKSDLVEPIIYLTIALTLLFLRKRKLLKHVTK